LDQENLIALGSNLGSGAGDRAGTLRAALLSLNAGGVEVIRVSRFFRTPCFPAGAGPDYVNACAAVRATIAPAALLQRLHRIERNFGRERRQRWGSRSLDLDLLAAGDAVLPDEVTQTGWRTLPQDDRTRSAPPELILPHPRLQDRGFVLVPLCDVAPDWRHPLLDATARAMRDALAVGARAEIVPL
jgi:2-amino-4-hydroxy-6-hydroxymethyldihydropteridine diphosphokinase